MKYQSPEVLGTGNAEQKQKWYMWIIGLSVVVLFSSWLFRRKFSPQEIALSLLIMLSLSVKCQNLSPRLFCPSCSLLCQSRKVFPAFRNSRHWRNAQQTKKYCIQYWMTTGQTVGRYVDSFEYTMLSRLHMWNNFEQITKATPPIFFLFSKKHKAGYDVNELCI